MKVPTCINFHLAGDTVPLKCKLTVSTWPLRHDFMSQSMNELGFETWTLSLGSRVSFSKFPETRIFKYSSIERNFRKSNYYYFLEEKNNNQFFFLRLACVTLTEKTAYIICIHQAKKDTITILSLCISTYQHPSPSSMQNVCQSWT